MLIRYRFFMFITGLVRKLPYRFRIEYWTMLYFYNKKKDPEGDFTLDLYQSYAGKR